MIIPRLEGRTLTKAHGAGNDFILFLDPDASIDISSEEVQKICDRHRGIGADGFIRIVPARFLLSQCDTETRRVLEDILASRDDEACPDRRGEEIWMMDYRNTDGSLASMCGNGVRVVAHYLRIQGLVDLTEEESIIIATRGGLKEVSFDGQEYTVAMGRVLDRGIVDVRGIASSLAEYPHHARAVDMPNPHAVMHVSMDQLESLRLPPVDIRDIFEYTPDFSEGVNGEFWAEKDGDIYMRVCERGVGETLACGTGTCAVAWDVLASRGMTQGTVAIHTPGGTLSVTIEKEQAYLTGPAILVAEFALIGIAGY